jgi:Lon protease-like protein
MPSPSTDLVEVSLFPIPGQVSLPQTTVPLHVFEPRYRKMIHDAVAQKRRIGVAHTQKVLAEAKVSPTATREEILSSNQKTYLPHPVFSAGFVEILETLPDGRLMVEIEMDSRFKIIEEVQSVPYKIARCLPFEDLPEETDQDLKSEIDGLVLSLLDGVLRERSQDPQVTEQIGRVREMFTGSDWRNQSMQSYSFRIFSIVGFEPDVLQRVLELQSARARLVFLRDLFTRGPLQ